MLLSLDPYQPVDFDGVRHQSLTDFLRGAPLGGSTDSDDAPVASVDKARKLTSGSG